MRDGVSAFSASALATALLHPLDTVKCRLQSGAYTVEPLCGEGGCLLGIPIPEWPRLRRRRPRARSSATSMQRQRLFSDVYTGCLANVAKEAPDAAVYLALYEAFSRQLLTQPWWQAHWMLTLLLAGALGDAFGSVLRLPAEVVAKRLQTGASPSVKDALLENPLSDWLDSWGAILARDVPMGGLQVAFFESCRAAITSASAAAPDPLATDVAAGVVAGALAAAFTTPLDVLVTHTLTAPPRTAAEAAEGGARPSALRRARALVEEQGAFTLTRGLGLRTLYYAPLVGLFFGLYEYFRGIL